MAGSGEGEPTSGQARAALRGPRVAAAAEAAAGREVGPRRRAGGLPQRRKPQEGVSFPAGCGVRGGGRRACPCAFLRDMVRLGCLERAQEGGHAGGAEGKVGCCLNRCRLGPRAVAGTTLTCRCPEGPRPQLSSPPSGGPRRPGSCGQGRPREQTPRRPGLSPGPLQQGPDLCPQGQDASRGWPVTGPSHCPPRRKGTRSQSGGAHRARVMVPSTLGLPTPAEGPPGAYLGGEGPPRQLARSQTAGR